MTHAKTLLKEKLKLDFVPVIFANGEDDDLPGYCAAVKNERVQYGDRIYSPNETIDIFGKTLTFFCTQIAHILDDGELLAIPPGEVLGNAVRIYMQSSNERDIYITSCTLNFEFEESKE